MNSSKLKIVIFDGSFETTAFIRRLMKGLTKDHQVFVIGFNENLKNQVERVRYVKLGSNQHKLSFIKTSVNAQGLSLTLLKNLIKGKRKKIQKKNLDKVLNDIQPDVIHAQWPSVLSWLEPYLQNQKYPVILSQRGYHTNVRPFVKKENYQYLQNLYPQLSGLHSVSQAIAKAGQKIGMPKTRIDKVVYTGLNLDDFTFDKNFKKQSKIEIISVGRPHWKKGYSYAIRACDILNKQNLDFHYTIVGGNEDEELLYLIREFNLERKVTLTGKLPQDQVFDLVRESSLFLLPSLEEGIANVAVESMALGTPVISTDCGGMEELIENNVNGFLISTRSEAKIATAVIKFSKLEESQIQQTSINARKKVEENFTESNMVKDMLALYQTVISAKSIS
ncbi:glycosyltransferase family 4 protein [Mesonia sp.]|uniref:glycosyltransferase family 4 protein n=1 Tax=Mesonia sp. TaxID=1960830 RepID=UPI00175724D0|nr:glycosyltransferase family 4 protein [Mesonia sp.]HIB37502.1 glycosyltransferase family 4 protein [Mesonia sp.]HIO27833.1 glycosyltransferase family 4 protein [Flavobacteriaceae bacterium]